MRQVQRQWAIRRHSTRVRVSTVHPQFGLVERGTIRRVGSEADGRGRWQVTDFDCDDVGEVVGNYIDAEKRLLDATAALDELVPPEELESEPDELPMAANLGGSDE